MQGQKGLPGVTGYRGPRGPKVSNGTFFPHGADKVLVLLLC